MRLFFDTSALVKFFHEEEGSPKVTELIRPPDSGKIVIKDPGALQSVVAPSY